MENDFCHTLPSFLLFPFIAISCSRICFFCAGAYCITLYSFCLLGKMRGEQTFSLRVGARRFMSQVGQ